MKVIRAPLRVSLFGGGTDLDPYCSEHGSTIISFAINRHIYLIWNDRHTGGCHLSYSVIEELDSLMDAKHKLVSQAAIWHGIPEPCTLTIVSDLPKGTGLGSSSALAVCLMRLICPNKRGLDCVIAAHEIERQHSQAGWQDYLPAVFGGFHTYHVGNGSVDDVVFVSAEEMHPPVRNLINRYGLLLYTGQSRPSDSVLPSWQKSDDQLHRIKALADEVAEQINDISVEHLAQYLNATWVLKREIGKVTSPVLNKQYALAMMSGAVGGKLCGAGAGGCWFFLVHPDARERVKDALGLREIPFQVSQKGVESWEL